MSYITSNELFVFEIICKSWLYDFEWTVDIEKHYENVIAKL